MQLVIQVLAVVSTVLAITGWSLRHGLKEQVASQTKLMTEMWSAIKGNALGLGELRLSHVRHQAEVTAVLESQGRELGEIKGSVQRIEAKIYNGG